MKKETFHVLLFEFRFEFLVCKYFIFIFIFSMNPMFVAALAVVAVASIADATFVIATVSAGAVTLSSAGVVSLGLLGGVVLLKGLLLGTLIARRGKRSAESDQDAAFAVLTNSEPDQCYRRLICDMAAGAIPDQGKILSLFNGEVSPVSPKFEYVTAAKVGKIVKNSGLCEVRYTCPLNTQEIAKLFN